MHIGYATAMQAVGETSDQQVLADEVRLCAVAEEVGMDSVWVTEHHFSSYSMSTNPLQVLTYLAGKLRTIKFGSMVVVVPWHDPVRLAEQIVLLDQLSGGRYILGFGRGQALSEFHGLRINIEEKSSRFMEISDLVLRAIEDGVMEGGATFHQPRVELRPRPNRTFVGRRFGAVGSPDSAPQMARLGLAPLLSMAKPAFMVKADHEAYVAGWKDAHPNASVPKPFIQNWIFVDESRDRANEIGGKYLRDCFLSAAKHYGMPARDTLGAHIKTLGLGTPQDCLDTLSSLRSTFNMTGILPNFIFGGMPVQEGERNLRYFAKHVLPELRSWKQTTT